MKKLSLCMIAKDEEENIAQCLDSVAKHVDEIIVVDTGSTDKTREVAVRYGASVYEFSPTTHPEAFFVDSEEVCKAFGAPPPYSDEVAFGDFGAARNESFKHASGDYMFWCDCDDVIENPQYLREIVADMDARGVGLGFLKYDYARDHLGRVFYSQWRERVIKKGVASWVNAVHEVLMPNAPVMHQQYPQTLISHRRKADRKSIANRNYKLLLRHIEKFKRENPGVLVDPRTLFYLGQEARFIEPRKAVGFYEEYLQNSGWCEERAAAHCAIGQLLEFGAVGLTPGQAYAQANREYATAAAEIPSNPDGVFGLARIAYLRGRYVDCINYSERGFAIGNTDSMLGMNPMDRLYRPHVYYNHALSMVGRFEEALKSCEAALSVCPDDPGIPGGASGMVTYNAQVYRDEIEKRKKAVAAPSSQEQTPMTEFDKNEDVDLPPVMTIPRDAVIIWAMQLWKQIVACGDLAKARTFLESMPDVVTSDPAFARMVASTERRSSGNEPAWKLPKTNVRKGVVFYLGPGVEPWDPTTPATKGLGGSETAAIELAKHLHANGRDVTVYAEAEGAFDGVRYLHHSKFKGSDCEVFIASRAPWAIDQGGPVNADVKLLWVHDIHCGPNSPQMERWLYQFDRILCLSQWHKSFFLSAYPSVHQDQIVVTRNGIDPARFSGGSVKENRLVFSSSPNRGLPTLLHNLRYIQERVPDVHLDVFYGFDTWETIARLNDNKAELDQIATYKKMLEDAQKLGHVTWHGRRSQTELAKAFMRAKVWGYPTEFPETSCITAMEAQAAGCVPVCTRFAALGETVKHGILIDPGPAFGEQFVSECVRMLTNERERLAIATSGRKWALENLSWAQLAKEWIEMFEVLAMEVQDNPVPIWRAS